MEKYYTVQEAANIIEKTHARVTQIIRAEKMLENGLCIKDEHDARVYLITEEGLNFLKNRSVARGRKLKSGETARDAVLKHLVGVKYTSYRDAAEICDASHQAIYIAITEMIEKGELYEDLTETGDYILRKIDRKK